MRRSRSISSNSVSRTRYRTWSAPSVAHWRGLSYRAGTRQQGLTQHLRRASPQQRPQVGIDPGRRAADRMCDVAWPWRSPRRTRRGTGRFPLGGLAHPMWMHQVPRSFRLCSSKASSRVGLVSSSHDFLIEATRRAGQRVDPRTRRKAFFPSRSTPALPISRGGRAATASPAGFLPRWPLKASFATRVMKFRRA